MRRSAGAGFGIGAAKCLTGCGTNPPPFIPQPFDSPTEATARVAAIRGTDLYEMTRETLDALGGMGSIVHPGETVFIKPNFGTHGFTPFNTFQRGESTKPEIVIALAEECLKAGASKVTIGEGGQIARFSWETVTTLDDSTNLAAEAARLSDSYPGQVELACLCVDTPEWDAVPSPHTDLGEIVVPKLVTQADRIISAAVLKTHRWTSVTGSLKNFVGVTPLDGYDTFQMGWRIVLHNAAGSIAQCFLDIVSSVKPDLAIIDGSICCESNGPNVFPGWWGTSVDVRDHLGDWFMLGSTDLAAADATAARIIGQDVDQIDHLQMAYDQGIGQIREDMIDVDGATIAELRMDWVPAELTVGFGEVILPGLLMKLVGGLW
ncbi:MAG: DUF362 domain-containing protein [Phycisphaerae bacterium]|nr:DUF362 domain-containing protein [Phycisphaerae bacterium]